MLFPGLRRGTTKSLLGLPLFLIRVRVGLRVWRRQHTHSLSKVERTKCLLNALGCGCGGDDHDNLGTWRGQAAVQPDQPGRLLVGKKRVQGVGTKVKGGLGVIPRVLSGPQGTRDCPQGARGDPQSKRDGPQGTKGVLSAGAVVA